MKKAIGLLLLFALLTYLVPFLGCLLPQEAKAKSEQAAPQTSESSPQSTPKTPVYDEAPLLILDQGSGEVLSVPVKAFVMGAVAAEMPMTYPDEALKAQAVASHSYALAVKASADGSDESLKGAYFKANPAQRMGYITDEMMKTMWGDEYTDNYNRLNALVDEIIDKAVAYNGAAALCCYHAISAGTTESSEAVWGTAVPYLVSVPSTLDTTSDGYGATISMTSQEMYESLVLGIDGIELSGEPAGWFGESTLDAAGYVHSVNVGSMTVSGTAIRSALSLRSAAFDVKFENHEFTVTTRGYGHGVGMSQYGASAMAKNGSTWREILAAYFPNTEIKTVKELAA